MIYVYLQEKSAQQGIPLLKRLIEIHQNDDFQIMPGGGINETNLLEILKTTNAEEFHASARIKKHSNMQIIVWPLSVQDRGDTTV